MSFFAAFINRQFIHKPPVPTASFRGRTIIVTGGNSGLGKEACRWLVRLSAEKVIIACRTIDKGQAVAKEIQESTSCSPRTIEVWHLDMNSYASVKSFAQKVRNELPRLDALLGNAGLVGSKFRITEDNEEMITTNVVSTFLVAFLLLPKLRETATRYKTQTHFTVTTSELYEVAKFKERKAPEGKLFATLNDEKKAKIGDRYNVSKLLQIFMIKQMASMLPFDSNNVIINGVAPGYCRSGLGREYNATLVSVFDSIFARPTEVGSRTLVYGASTGPEGHGQYIPDCRITPTKGLCEGQAGVKLQARIWHELKEKLERIEPGVTDLSKS